MASTGYSVKGTKPLTHTKQCSVRFQSPAGKKFWLVYGNGSTSTPTGKRPLGTSRRKWEDSIRMDLREIGINTRNWADSAQDRDYWRALVSAVFNLWVS